MTTPLIMPSTLNNSLLQIRQVPTGLQRGGRKAPTRVLRKPKHNFQLRHKPFVLQPFMLAPVLAGETLKNVMLQARAVTSPIKNQVVGWHLEHYVYYVPLRMMDRESIGTDGQGNNGPGGPYVGSTQNRTEIERMLMDASYVLSDNPATTGGYLYGDTSKTANWVARALNAVIATDFRHADEVDGAWNKLDGQPMAKLTNQDISDSIYDVLALPPAPDTITVDVDAGTPDTVDINLGELQGAYDTWSQLVALKVTQMTFDDYLGTFGITQPKGINAGKIELVRYSREWQYPSNTVNPSTGAPSSAVSWGINFRADKDRFFKEPGVLIGITCSRPKTYRNGQICSASLLLSDALAWMPATLREQPGFSLRTFNDTEGPYVAATGAPADKRFTLDLRDLYIYGDQYVNFALNDAASNFVTSPALNEDALDDGVVNEASEYATDADVDALFPGSTDAARIIHQDGVCQLHILGTQVDQT